MLLAATQFTLSNLIGAILVLAGLYLVVSGAPQVEAANTAGFWPILGKILRRYPRVAIGILLIIIGGIFMGVDFGPLIAGEKAS